MNNLNDPPHWNIRPEAAGEGDDAGRWNYALLVPMIGLAAFRWIWSRESQNQIQDMKKKYESNVEAISKDLEMKHSETLRENQRTAAHLALELEKERQRVQGYRSSLISQSQQLLEERKQLQQERQHLEEEKKRLLESGEPGVALREALRREEAWHNHAQLLLQELEEKLIERQEAFCSILFPRQRRVEMEEKLLVKATQHPLGAQLKLEGDLRDIFKNDRHCADLLNMERRRNGSLMWLYLRFWQLQITLSKHQRAEDRFRETSSKTH
ncbi:hypothetical protein DNTS_004048 [Danionella cerebrum]|uniref:Coiled-coil domain-containing protein 127 n=1 Tax=Danionella cerebrum TaxID=2873325 RepID=A0A553RE30_9TELE|nr:hypothetical protein DNTS_021477 [Danionella translucida]TRZ00448.1 hypothetical protein DNTS_004048 [Danionella translucida]